MERTLLSAGFDFARYRYPYRFSEVENKIAPHGKLIMSLTVVVSLPIPGSLKTHLGTNLHRGTDPMTPHECVLRVSGCVAGTLPFFVVEKITPKGEEVVRRQFLLQEIHHGILGSRAPL